MSAFFEVAIKFKKLLYTPILPFLVQKLKNVKDNLELILFKITEKFIVLSCVKQGYSFGEKHIDSDAVKVTATVILSTEIFLVCDGRSW